MFFSGVDGLRIAASIVGPEGGFPVLLAHGGGQTRWAWKKTTQMLEQAGFRSIAIDLRGHGESDWADEGAYDIRDFAGDLIAVARQLKRPAAVIGASLGGLAGLVAEGELANGSFASLTLVDIAPKMEVAGVGRVIGFMMAHSATGFASPDEAARVISEYMPQRAGRKASANLDRYLRRGPNGRYFWHWDPKFIANVTSVGADDPQQMVQRLSALDAAASNLRLPVHLVRGGSSDLVSKETIAHFREVTPHAEFTDIADATHMVVGDQNDAFASAILDFLQRHHGQQAPA